MEHIKEIQSFMRLAEAQLHEAVKAYDMKQLEMAGNLIQEAEQKGCRIHVTGIGKPAHLAGYAASLLSSTGTPAYFLDGTEAVHGSAGQVAEQDVVIVISNSGNTAELKQTVTTLKQNRAVSLQSVEILIPGCMQTVMHSCMLMWSRKAIVLINRREPVFW